MKNLLWIAVLSFLSSTSAHADNKWGNLADHIHNAFRGSYILTEAIETVAMPSDDPNEQPSEEAAIVMGRINETCTITKKESSRGGTVSFSGAHCATPSTATMNISQMTEKVIKAQIKLNSTVNDAHLLTFLNIGGMSTNTTFAQTMVNGVNDSSATIKGTIASNALGKMPYTLVVKSHSVDGDDTKSITNINQTFNVGRQRGNVWVHFANEDLSCAIDGQKSSGADCLAALYLMGMDFNSVQKIKNFKL